MAATMTTPASTAAVMAPSASTTTRRSSSSSSSSSSKVAMRKLKNFGGLKPESRVTRMGMAQSTEEAFAVVKSRCSGRASRGGALAANMDVASEVFFVVPIMSALTLVGIVVGFVLLRVEASVEEE